MKTIGLTIAVISTFALMRACAQTGAPAPHIVNYKTETGAPAAQELQGYIPQSSPFPQHKYSCASGTECMEEEHELCVDREHETYVFIAAGRPHQCAHYWEEITAERKSDTE